MQNISGFGLTAQVTASKSFPNGFTVTAFAHDQDPLESPDFETADTATGLNGDMVIWSRPGLIEITMSVIPLSPDDENLAALLEANRIGKNKVSARDVCGIVWNFPNGMIVNCSPGAILSGQLIPAVTAEGRVNTRRYRFRFEQVSKTGGE